MAQHTLQVNGVRYHAEVEGSGLPLVLLHGFTGSSESWWQIRPALSKQFMTVTVDLLGHGLTEAPEDSQRYTMAFAAQDLAAIFSELQLSYTHLLGYSMGGRLALYLALHHPTLVKTLILESASPGLATEAERADRIQSDERLARKIQDEGIEAFVDYWTNLPLFATQPDELRQRLREQRLNNRTRGLASSLRGMGTGTQPSLWEKLERLSCPTLLIAGRRDAKFVRIAHEMAAQMPNARALIVPDVGHAVHAEQPDFYVQTVLEFLSSYD